MHEKKLTKNSDRLAEYDANALLGHFAGAYHGSKKWGTKIFYRLDLRTTLRLRLIVTSVYI